MDESSTASAGAAGNPSQNQFDAVSGAAGLPRTAKQPPGNWPASVATRPAPAGLVGTETSTTPFDAKALFSEEFRVLRRLRRMKRSIGSAGDQVKDRAAWRGLRVTPLLITLTYRGVSDWCPRDVSRFLDDVRIFCRRRGFNPVHLWVMELQKRGAPHYHVIIWIRSDIWLPEPDKAGWWPWGTSNIKRAKRPVGYALKYASKFDTKHELPRGARLHGRGGLTAEEKLVVRWWVIPRYQRERCTPQDDVRRARGGGWVSRTTGEWWPPWQP